MSEVADAILRHGVSMLGATSGMVAILSDDHGAIELVQSYGCTEDLVAELARVPLEAELPLTDAMRSGEPILLESLESLEEGAIRYPRLARAHCQTLIAIPLLSDGRATGVVTFLFECPRAFDPRERLEMKQLSYECGLALDRARLRRAAEEAHQNGERAADRRTEFLALLAHELRNPLAPIRTAAEILELRPSADPAVEHSRKIIQRQVAHLSRLIDDLLDSSRSAGPGLGSEVTISLPRAPTPPPSLAVPTPPMSTARRVLLIEDNLDAAETLATYLEMVGHVVEVENDASGGIEAAHRFLPDVVVCDIGLPGPLDGYAIARSLRANPRFSSTLLVALTGYGQEHHRRRSIEAGFDRHTTKPVDPTALASWIAGVEGADSITAPISWREV